MTNSGSGAVAPTKSPISQLWKQLGGNPKSMSTDSLSLPSPVEPDHRLNSEMGAVHMPVLSPKENSGEFGSSNKRLSGVWGASSPSSNEYRMYRDNFLSNRHGFTGRVFGVSLSESLSVASAEVIVQSELVSFGRIPIVVAKCGAYLKANALETSGIFRIAGNSKRVKELQYIFSSPPDYGSKFVDWDAYTVHDVASLLRRFLNNLEEPLIPLDLYEAFRKPLRDRPRILRHMAKQVVPSPAAENEDTILLRRPDTATDKDDRDNDGDEEKEEDDPAVAEEKKRKSQRHRKRLIRDIKAAIKDYENLFISISNDTKQLTIYLLDLLSLFARQSQFNLMSGRNLAAIFQPSILSHPQHDMDPREYELSRLVTEFLIEYSYKLLPHLLRLARDEQQRPIQQGRENGELEAPKPRKLVVTNENNESVTVSPSAPIDIPALDSSAAQDNPPTSTTVAPNTTTFESPTKSSTRQPLKVPKIRRPHSRSIGSAPVPPDVIASSRRRSRLFPWLPKPGILSDNGGDFTATEEEGDESNFDDENRETMVSSPVSAQSTSLPRHHLHIPPMNRTFSGNSTTSSLTRRPMSAILGGSRNGSMDALENASANQANESTLARTTLLEDSETEEGTTRSRKRDSWFQRLRSRSRSNTRS
ncbi:hypothetical protein HG536_0A04890 [Torulaspora globosa]|uniref:Rho-GAP domain-containing protein n=1 Tax=Torulaspora globosa TaxID=48254 RepID=A0A7G3ZAY8_9SACH|nr:uncharacterized protein HG536_0A04890 [Torulaspora globosa]QLL30674.1 hypothetical protein HG536_0A04890 [Torulaspora globosa]